MIDILMAARTDPEIRDSFRELINETRGSVRSDLDRSLH